MLRTVDLNGNGTIEFDEYCWMVSDEFRLQVLLLICVVVIAHTLNKVFI